MRPGAANPAFKGPKRASADNSRFFVGETRAHGQQNGLLRLQRQHADGAEKIGVLKAPELIWKRDQPGCVLAAHVLHKVTARTQVVGELILEYFKDPSLEAGSRYKLLAMP